MSTSYPYRQVALDHGVPYGLVLSYIDMVEARAKFWDYTVGLTYWTHPSRFGPEDSPWTVAARAARASELSRRVLIINEDVLDGRHSILPMVEDNRD